MAASFLLATAEPNQMLFLLKAALLKAFRNNKKKASLELVASDCEQLRKSEEIRDTTPGTVLLLDASLPASDRARHDHRGQAALATLRVLRERDNNKILTLVLTDGVMAMSEIDHFCEPYNNAIALPSQWLDQPQVLAGFIHMLRGEPGPVWNVIEIDIPTEQKVANCWLGNRAGNAISWGSAPLAFSQLSALARKYSNYQFSEGWSRDLHLDGGSLFKELVISALGPGLFTHLEIAAGGLEGLAFRFRVDNPSLHTAPFEATVRLAGQLFDTAALQDEFTLNPFVLPKAPITRRIKTIAVRIAAPRDGRVTPEVLFIRSQMGENPAGPSPSDTVAIAEVNQATGGVRFRHREFRKLDNIDSELEHLRSIENGSFSLRVLDLSKARDPAGAEQALRRELAGKRYDVVHFAGHSLTINNGGTFLIIPGEKWGEAEGMPIGNFASIAAGAGARLVYLSSCQGSSAQTVASLAQHGVQHVMGFRWNVEDERAAAFATLFYRNLFGATDTICGAFRAACQGVYRQGNHIEHSSIWASPILVSQADDWSVQRVM